jgi:hypothetical protein
MKRRPPPLTLMQVGPDLWRVAYVDRPSFECSTSTAQQRQVLRAALAAREKPRVQP